MTNRSRCSMEPGNEQGRSGSSRRGFLRQLGLVGLGAALPSRSLPGFAEEMAPAALTTSAVRNRAPLARNAFYPLPLGAITPSGWLRNQLRIQANGLGGHLDETWPDVGPQQWMAWRLGRILGAWSLFSGWPGALAYLLDDSGLKAKAQKYIEWTLSSQTADGMFGPRSNDDWWPRMVMLKVLTQYQEATADPRVIPLMQSYFNYQRKELSARPLSSWGKSAGRTKY